MESRLALINTRKSAIKDAYERKNDISGRVFPRRPCEVRASDAHESAWEARRLITLGSQEKGLPVECSKALVTAKASGVARNHSQGGRDPAPSGGEREGYGLRRPSFIRIQVVITVVRIPPINPVATHALMAAQRLFRFQSTSAGMLFSICS